jgi:DNA modification methylase
VVDLFGGSGSTLIACARQKRRARLMEIDPRYVDVTLSRWQRLFGKEATLEHGGTFSQVAGQRLKAAA